MGNTCCGGNSPAQKTVAVQKVNYAFFEALPAGVQEATIDHVYDGDTLTIREQNRARVRFLGIDAPELKEREPYAQEAADYVKHLCPPGTRIWLRLQPSEKKDRHNRLLALVFVANPQAGQPGFLCVNIALLQEGLASFYEPGETVVHREQMLKAQKAALDARANIWKRVDLRKVVMTTPNGIAFHNSDCIALQKTKPHNLRRFSVAEALEKGYSPCRECKPLEVRK